MSIKAVFRVQCDGPGKEWLSWPEDYVPGTALPDEILVAEPTAVRACNWPGERAARRAALGAGWVQDCAYNRLLCPTCKVNPLGITLPSNGRCEARTMAPRPVTAATDAYGRVARTIQCELDTGHAREHRHGGRYWF